MTFYAGADDGVILRVDGETVLERNPAVGMHTVARTVELAAGAHRLEIDHWQDGGARSLNVQWAPAGGPPTLLSPTRLFPEDPGALGYWLQVGAVRLPVLVLLVWATGVAVLVGLTVWRAFYRRVTSLSPDERWRRLRTVLFPALLGPSQLLLFGPWTVHDTNPTEFLVGFWELAPGWVWLLGPVVGALAALGHRHAGPMVPTVRSGTLRGRGAALGAGEPAARRLRAPGRRRARPGIARVANAVRSRRMGLCAPSRRGIRQQGRSRRAGRVRGAGEFAAGNRPSWSRSAEWRRLDAPPTATAETTWRLPPPEIYELSGTRNLIHIVLDTFPTHTFAGILDADRPAFDRDWPGFTFFANHLGAHRTTFFSMPAMLSGVAFRNEMPFREFVARQPSVFHVLGQQGYRLRSLASYGNDHLNPAFPGVDAAIRYDIPTPYGSYRDYVDVAAAQLLDLSLFRHAPHAFKPNIYRDRQWLLPAADRGAAGTGGNRGASPLETPRFCVTSPIRESPGATTRPSTRCCTCLRRTSR